MTIPRTVLTFGEILWDMLPSGDVVLGGAPFNLAYRLHSLGTRSLFVSRLGEDDRGRQAFDAIVSLGMDKRFLQTDPTHSTGAVRVFLDAGNQPDYFIVPDAAYDFVELTKDLLKSAKEADGICFGTLAQRAPRSRQTLRDLLDVARQGLKILDINLRKNCYDADSIAYSLNKADILKLNENEAEQLSRILKLPHSDMKDFVRRIMDHWALKYCVVTLGGKGALGMSRDGEMIYTPGYRVNLVDPLGAGDAFAAAFVHALLAGSGLREACEAGNALGAIVATQQGATQPITAEEIKRFRNMEHTRIYEERHRKIQILKE